jgi:hypothetical protein
VFLKTLNALCVCLQYEHPRSMKRVIRSDKPVTLLLLFWSHKCDVGAEPRSRIIATGSERVKDSLVLKLLSLSRCDCHAQRLGFVQPCTCFFIVFFLSFFLSLFYVFKWLYAFTYVCSSVSMCVCVNGSAMSMQLLRGNALYKCPFIHSIC